MEKGTIKFFNEVSGYGFICPETSGQKDVFFHFSGMRDGHTVTKKDKGKAVNYSIKEGKNGPEAEDIIIVPIPKK